MPRVMSRACAVHQLRRAGAGKRFPCLPSSLSLTRPPRFPSGNATMFALEEPAAKHVVVWVGNEGGRDCGSVPGTTRRGPGFAACLHTCPRCRHAPPSVCFAIHSVLATGVLAETTVAAMGIWRLKGNAVGLRRKRSAGDAAGSRTAPPLLQWTAARQQHGWGPDCVTNMSGSLSRFLVVTLSATGFPIPDYCRFAGRARPV